MTDQSMIVPVQRQIGNGWLLRRPETPETRMRLINLIEQDRLEHHRLMVERGWESGPLCSSAEKRYSKGNGTVAAKHENGRKA
jgi:hypothetical protein